MLWSARLAEARAMGRALSKWRARVRDLSARAIAVAEQARHHAARAALRQWARAARLRAANLDARCLAAKRVSISWRKRAALQLWAAALARRRAEAAAERRREEKRLRVRAWLGESTA